MINPTDFEKLKSSKHRNVLEVINDIDDGMTRVHGWYPWEEAILPYEVPLHTRNRVCNMYIRAGWKYAYHHTSSENLHRPGITLFRFSMEQLDKDLIRGMYEVSEKDKVDEDE